MWPSRRLPGVRWPSASAISRAIAPSERDATIGCSMPSTCTNVRRPSPRSSPSSGTSAYTRSARTNLPYPSATSCGTPLAISDEDRTQPLGGPGDSVGERDLRLPPKHAAGFLDRGPATLHVDWIRRQMLELELVWRP